MANSYSTQPMILDTDIASYRTGASVTSGVRILKLALVVGGSAASAGTVTITLPANSKPLYIPLVVANAAAANSLIINDNPTGQAVLTWQDFAVTGLTATGTKLYLWTSGSGANAS